jgi:Galactose oxidase, central domain
MIRKIAGDFIPYRLLVLTLTVLFLSSCHFDTQPSGIEGSGTRNTPPPQGPATQGAPPPQSGLSMTTARAEHTATLLRDGRVLIAGGYDAGLHPLASAELYDPIAGTFTRTGDMTEARASHTATLLANGNVLIAGGHTAYPYGWSTALDSAEIYDPSTETFTATGKMNSRCCGGGWVSTLLPDGRVFIANNDNAEIYDPGSGSFTLTGAYEGGPIYWVDATALLPDGKVLVVGVLNPVGTAGTSQLFDPTISTFSSTGLRACIECVSTATVLLDGEVLFIEPGWNNMSDQAEIYNEGSGTFVYLGGTLDSQSGPVATRLDDGTVLLTGGELPGTVNPVGNPAVERYVPASGKFVPAASLSTGRYDHTATLLPDGTVLIVGGYSAWQQPTASTEIYK